MTTEDDSINALVDNLAPPKFIYIFLLEYNNSKIFIATIQRLSKYISNLKRKCKKLSQHTLNIINNNYTFQLLEQIPHTNKQEIKNVLSKYHQLEENAHKPLERKLNDDLYKKSLQYEYAVLDLLNNIFINSRIIRSKNRYSKYDFLDLNTGYFFELKTNTYSINDFSNAVINVEKLDYPHLILVFGYNNTIFKNGKFTTAVQYYYIFYNEKQFALYNKRYIINKLTGRPSYVIDIPTSDLNELNENKPIHLSSEINNEINKIMHQYHF